jgi:RNA-directed DNA polymerase
LKGARAKRVWIVDADLSAAFDRIDHPRLLTALGSFPARGMVARWLRAGVVEKGVFTPIREGSPQGGVISPLLMNVALHGMEDAAGVRYRMTGVNAGNAVSGTPILVRYADDVAVCCYSQQQAGQVQARLAEWLLPRGLVFNEDKTQIVHVGQSGFAFLGFHLRRYRNGKLLIKPSPAAVRRLRERLAKEVRGLRGSKRGGGHRQAQPHHPGLGRLLPRGGVQQGLLRSGQLPVEADLQVGQTQPPQQVEEVGCQTLLRQVQQVQERPVGLRGS